MREREKRPRAKLSPDEVLEIHASTEDYKAVAKRFGISTRYVFYLRNRQNWKKLWTR